MRHYCVYPTGGGNKHHAAAKLPTNRGLKVNKKFIGEQGYSYFL